MNNVADPGPAPDSLNLPMTAPLSHVRLAALEAGITPQRGPVEPLAVPAARLRVIRGLRLNTEFHLFDGPNLIGRRDDRPVDVDLTDLEPADRVWASRHHALITIDQGHISLEDLNSTNGSFVNRKRVPPGEKASIVIGDIVQVGTIQFKVTP